MKITHDELATILNNTDGHPLAFIEIESKASIIKKKALKDATGMTNITKYCIRQVVLGFDRINAKWGISLSDKVVVHDGNLYINAITTANKPYIVYKHKGEAVKIDETFLRKSNICFVNTSVNYSFNSIISIRIGNTKYELIH